MKLGHMACMLLAIAAAAEAMTFHKPRAAAGSYGDGAPNKGFYGNQFAASLYCPHPAMLVCTCETPAPSCPASAAM